MEISSLSGEGGEGGGEGHIENAKSFYMNCQTTYQMRKSVANSTSH